MATILHAADLHLGSALRGLRLNHRDADWSRPVTETAGRLAATALGSRADLVVLSGDIADREGFDPRTALALRRALATLHDAGIPVIAIDGNHDAALGARRRLLDEALAATGSVRRLSAARAETVVFDDLGVAVHGRSVPNPQAEADLSATYPGPVPGLTNIGLLHTSLDGTRPGKPCAPVDPAALAAHGYDYWALGHVHQHEAVRTEPWIAYAGAPQGRGSHEDGAKGATIVETGPRGEISGLRLIETASVRWETIRIDAGPGARPDELAARAAAAATQTLSRLPDGQRLAARVRVTGPPSTPRDRRTLEHALAEAAAALFLLEGVTWGARAPRNEADAPAPATIEISETAAAEPRRRTTKE